MTDQPETFQRLSVAEAARLLGVSVATVRRRIRTGELEAETIIRPQGTAFVVRLPLDASAGVSDAYDRDQEPHSTMRPQASPELAVTAMVQTTIATVLGPLMAEQAALRQTVERQADQLVSQAETIGELRAENRALVARTEAQNEEALRALFPSRWRVLAPWVLAVLAIVVAVGLLAPVVR